MSESSDREALDGLTCAVEAAVGDDSPTWIAAYEFLLTDEILDRHRIGLMVGLARAGDHAANERWMAALHTADGDDVQRWALEAIWCLAERRELSDADDAAASPMMRRVVCELRAWALREARDLQGAMNLRRRLYDEWEGPECAHRVFCGLDVVDDLMNLARSEDASTLLTALEPAVRSLGDPTLTAELCDR